MEVGTILYVGGFELPDKDAAAHRVYNNAKLLQSVGYNVILLDIDRSASGYKGVKSRTDSIFEVWSHKFPYSTFSWFKYLTSIKNIVEIINKRKDIKAIICYNYQAIPLWKILKYAKKNGIKVIADCTEWHEDKRLIKIIDTEFRMRYLHKKVDGVICISQYLEDYYSGYVNTTVVPPLVDINEKKWETSKNSQIPDSQVVSFIYSGRPGRHKDKLNHIIESMIEFKSSCEINFTIVGITKDEYTEYYPEHTNIIEEMNNIVDFHGRVSHEESIALVKEADYQIFIRENKRVNNAGFPTKFVESMACGTPVITTKTSDLDKYLIEGKNGFFVDYNMNSLKKILKMIVKMDKSDIELMKDNCKNVSVFNYKSFENSVSTFLKKI